MIAALPEIMLTYSKILVIAGLLVELLGGIFFSVSAVSPRFVRGMAKRLARLVGSRPQSLLLRKGFDHAFPEARDQKCQCLDEVCDDIAFSILAARLLHWSLSLAAGAVILLLALRSSSAFMILLPVLVLLWSVMALFAIQFNINEKSWTGKLILLLLRPGFPLYRFLGKIFKLGSVAFFSSWYRSLKVVHSRGMRWSLAAGGLACIIVGAVFQIVAVFTPY